jgi:hypothetical protein
MKALPPIAELRSLSRVPGHGYRWRTLRARHGRLDSVGRWCVRGVVGAGVAAAAVGIFVEFELVAGIICTLMFLTMVGCIAIVRG